jgi:hypothetical protein
MQRGRLLQQSLLVVHSSILQQVPSVSQLLLQHSSPAMQEPPSPLQQLPDGWQMPLQHGVSGVQRLLVGMH